MHADLQKLIHLQSLDDAAEGARREIAGQPAVREALEARVAGAAQALAGARERRDAGQAARRDIERDLAAVQTRLSRYKGQLMEVKTNKEYQAMLSEIATAEGEVRALEDRVLERLLEADDLTAEVKTAEAALAEVTRSADEERAALDARLVALERQLQEIGARRAALVPTIDPAAMTLFEHVAGRRSPAVAEARDGHCGVCHVRLRPQVFNDVRRNDRLRQCESCGRILYFVPAPAGPAFAPEA